MKTCTKCKAVKHLSEFNKNKSTSDGLQCQCKVCHRNSINKSKQKHKKKACSKCKAVKHISEFCKNKSTSDGLASQCRVCHSQICKLYRKKNLERIRAAEKKYSANNRQKINLRRKKKRATCPKYRMQHRLRARLRDALHGSNKSASTMALLGCSIEYLKQYIEQQFTANMSWENRGSFHLDHIIPISSFDLTDPEQQRQCFHYSNLQPLNAKENLMKGSRILYNRVWTGEHWIAGNREENHSTNSQTSCNARAL